MSLILTKRGLFLFVFTSCVTFIVTSYFIYVTLHFDVRLSKFFPLFFGSGKGKGNARVTRFCPFGTGQAHIIMGPEGFLILVLLPKFCWFVNCFGVQNWLIPRLWRKWRNFG